MAIRRDEVQSLRAELDELFRPPAKVVHKSSREHFKDRARSRLQQIVDDAGCRGISQRELARRAGIADIYLRDMLHGRREIPLWIFDALPRDQQLVCVKALLSEIGESDDGEPPSSNGRAA